MMWKSLWTIVVAAVAATALGEDHGLGACHPYFSNKNTWCVDLSNGIREVPPIGSGLKWMSYHPKAGRCNDQAVLQIIPPSWAKSLRIEEEAVDSAGWNINLGDSITNNGWGGDASTTEYDAELQVSSSFLVYRNDVCGSGDIPESNSRVNKTRMSTITVEKGGVNFYSLPSGQGYASYNNVCLLRWDDMYLGMNRVVSPATGQAYRTGTGLCKVCLTWQDKAATIGNTPRT